MKKAEYLENMKKLKKEVLESPKFNDKTKTIKKRKRVKKEIAIKNKICPFRSDSRGDVECSSDCVFFNDHQKEGWNCILKQVGVISWNLTPQAKKSNFRNARYNNNY